MLCIVIFFSGSDSESLQDENVIGNVSKFAVVPPNYTGPVKRGHLIFNADFECGKMHLSFLNTMFGTGTGNWDCRIIEFNLVIKIKNCI